jgi:hypothetical protein
MIFGDIVGNHAYYQSDFIQSLCPYELGFLFGSAIPGSEHIS